MEYCSCCGEQVETEFTYKDMVFCSVNCMDRHLLHMCVSGEISFLDLPKETRDRESNRKSLKCHARECEVCGNTFYVNISLEGRRKYCSDKCTKIAMKTIREKNWWKTVGWMNYNWKGRINNGIYCHKFNADLRRRVRTFFENKCFLCGKPQEENPKRLAVHHVNYNKNACCDSSRVMLVPLCEQCHGKTNQNREYWEDYFEIILKEKYNFKCYYSKEEYNKIKHN